MVLKSKKKQCPTYRKFGIAVGVILGVYVTIKFLFPLLAPFLLAYLLVLLMNPLITKIRNKIRINRGLLAGVFILLLVLILGVASYFLCEIAIKELRQLFTNWKIYRVWAKSYVNQCCCSLEGFLDLREGTLTAYVSRELPGYIGKLKSNVLPVVMQSSWGYMKHTFAIVGAIFVGIIASILMLSDYEKLHGVLEKMPGFSECQLVKNRLLKAGLVFLKAQFIIMAVIATICFVTLLFMGNSYALLLGVGIGVLDALPMLGTGLVLLPWGVIALTQGKIAHGIVLIVLYGVTSLVREFLEPKLMGNQMGLPPVFFLASVYWGLYLFGLWGVVLGPIAAILVVEILKCVFCPGNLDKE